MRPDNVTAEHDHPEHILVAYDEDEPEIPVARAYSVPFEFGTDRRTVLSPDGWDAVIQWAALDRSLGRTPRLRVGAGNHYPARPARSGPGRGHTERYA